MPGRIFDFFIFSSVFIAGCAVLMAYQVNDLFQLDYRYQPYLWFVFFSTVCSYNFHWYLTPHTASENKRTLWTQKHKGLHLVLIVLGFIGALAFIIPLMKYWPWIGFSVFLTFLYSAPKLPFRAAYFLRKIAIGKTIFLALVWMYVTSILPIILSGVVWDASHILFCIGRFFFIYAICVIFDFRDREQDKRDGIRSMITYFNESGINAIFYTSIFVYFVTTLALYNYNFPILVIIILLLPALIVIGLYRYSKENFSDYLYYFILDGMMAFSALMTAFLPF
jgi:4-hydroxybenzoate polyprenyltransferase